MITQHYVELGETWQSIADHYGVPLELLLAFNGLETAVEPPPAGLSVYVPDVPSDAIGAIFGTPDTGAVFGAQPSGFPIWDWITERNVQDLQTSFAFDVQQVALLESSVADWKNYDEVRQVESASEIVWYDAATDTYYFADGSRVERSDLLQAFQEQLSSSGEFDPDQATSDWLRAIGASGRFSLDTAGGVEAGLRDRWLAELFMLTNFVGDFGEEGISRDDFLMLFGDLPLDDLAELTLDAGQRAALFSAETGASLDLLFAEELEALGLQDAASMVGWHNLYDALELAGGYLSVTELDEIRQTLRDWTPQQEVRLLAALQAEINKMPLSPVWGIPCVHVRGRFQSFHSQMQQRHDWLLEQQTFVAEYERERAARAEEERLYEDTSLPWWMELIINLGSEFNPVAKGADFVLVLRDLWVYRDALSLAGLIPFVTSHAMRAARTVRRLSSSVHRRIRFIANFGHAADLDAANTARLHHIFDARLGHVPDSVANRQMLINTVNRSNYLGLDTHGNRWYASIRPDGKQIWVRVRNGEIINGGVNDIPKQWTPTGLK